MADKGDKGVKQEAAPQKAERPPLLVSGQLIAAHSGKRYVVERQLGKGGFGEVYLVSVYKDPRKKFAMKVELNAVNGKASSMLRLKVEIHVFEQIVQSKRVDRTHFVKMHDKGMTEQFKYYVMDVVWNSLKDMCQKTLNNAPLSGSTLVGIARQTLKSIRAMHELGFLHRDIKWQNFAVGLPPMDYLIYIIDFGIARPYKEKNGKVRIARETVPFLGTLRYGSIRGLRKEEQGRRDDLESWLYMMMEMYSKDNCLWLYAETAEELIAGKIKVMENSEQLYKEGKLKMPKNYCKMIAYVNTMKYEEEPDYQWFDIALIAGAKAENIDPDAPFDWIGMYEEDKKREEQKRKEEEARKIPDKVVRDEQSKYSETDRKESRMKAREKEKKGDRRNKNKKKKKQQPEGEDQTLISMEEMLEDLKKEKKKRLKKKSGERTEDEYWKSDEDTSEDDRSDEDDSDYRGRKKKMKKKSGKRRSRERTRDYSDRDDDDDDDYGRDDRYTYDKTPHRRRGQKKSSGGRKKASKHSRKKKTFEDEENIPRIPDPKIPDEESKNVDEGVKKTPAKTPGKTPDKKTPEKKKAQDDLKEKDKKDKDKKESGKKDEKPPVKTVPVEPAKKASEAAPKKEPADAKKN